MKTKGSLRLLTILMSLIMVFAMIPQFTVPVHAAEGDDAIILVESGSAPHIEGGKGGTSEGGIYFGHYLQSWDQKHGFIDEPIKWRVLQNADGKMFLLSDQCLERKPFNEMSGPITWETCTLRAWLNGSGDYAGNSFIGSAFSTEEQNAITTTHVIDEASPIYGTPGGNDTDDKIFLLSVGEITNSAYGFPSMFTTNTDYANTEKVDPNRNGCYYWLRTRGEYSQFYQHTQAVQCIHCPNLEALPLYYFSSLYYEMDGLNTEGFTVRPAMKLDLSSVLFTSEAIGGKVSNSTNQYALTRVGANTSDAWKFTLKDDGSLTAVGSGHAGFSVDSVDTSADDKVTVSYSGAATGNNEFISAIIKTSDGRISHYGRVEKATSSQGTATIDIGGKLTHNATLYVFNEQYNGDGKTDYASAMHKITGVTGTAHDWEFVDFTWTGNENDGYTKAVANYVCRIDGSHTTNKEARVTSLEALQPKCTTDGWTTYTAYISSTESLDNFEHADTRYADYPKAMGHEIFSWGCIDDNYHEITCSRCGKTETVRHTWDAGTVKEAATCTENGKMLYTCTGCRMTKEEEIIAGHSYGNWEKLNDDTHQRICSLNSSHIETQDHSWDEGIVKEAPTCSKTGTMLYTCTVCRGTKEEAIDINQNGHKYGAWINLNGTQHQRICSHNSSHVETEEHTWDAGIVKQAPTCSKAGVMLYTCTECSGTKEEPIDVNQNNHKYGAWTNLNVTQHQRVCLHNSSHVEKANHTWDAGKVTKQATTTETGVKTYTCTVCKGTKTETIPKLQDQKGTDGTAVGSGASSQAAEKAITTLKKDADPKGAVFARIQLKSPSQTKTSVKISWKKTSGATKYVIYGNACGAKNKMKKLATVTGTSKNFTKVAGKKVKKGTYYKFMVVALDKNNKVVSTSKMIHVATKGGKVGNHKSVTVKAKIGGKTKAVSKVTLKKGKTLALKTTLNPVSKKTPVKKHVGVRYESSNSKIATVNGSGKITAKAKGTCYIYAYAQNGVVKAVKLTVK